MKRFLGFMVYGFKRSVLWMWSRLRAVPRKKLLWKTLGILALCGVSVAIIFPARWNGLQDAMNAALRSTPFSFVQLPRNSLSYRLGLDLVGGTHLIYQADVSNIRQQSESEALEGARDVIERRVNAFGVSEPNIQVSGNHQIIVELAGVSDVHEAIRMIGETPLLEFKELNDAPDTRELSDEQKKELETRNEAAKKKIDEARKKLLSGQVAFEDIAKEYSEDAGTKETGGLLDIPITSNMPEYFAAAKKASVGKITEVIENSASFALLRVEERLDDKEVHARHLLLCYQGSTGCESQITQDEALKKILELKSQASPENFESLVKEHSTEPGADSAGGDLGFFQRGIMVKEFEDAAFSLDNGKISEPILTQFGYHLIHRIEDRPSEQYRVRHIIARKTAKEDILPQRDEWKNTNLSGKELESSGLQFHPDTNEIQVELRFNDEGKKLFSEITRRNIQKPVAIFLDGTPISIPTVQQEISDGNAVITGDFTVPEAKQLVNRLNAGALPLPIALQSQQTVGATLGAESLQSSLRAGIWGLILIGVFMIAVYRLPGLVSVIALLIYSAFVLAVFMVFGFVLTLSGIAGFILSIGMAVDANVLIFERMKEEFRRGKSFISALHDGVARAWPSIRDGNVSTLLTCFVLMGFGTSIIKGFAITLSIGILMSMFSAIVVTKVFLLVIAKTPLSRWNILFPGKKKFMNMNQ